MLPVGPQPVEVVTTTIKHTICPRSRMALQELCEQVLSQHDSMRT